MCRRIVITSGKGGVGKTTFTASLGTELARMGKRTLMIDADVGLNNLDVLLGVENRVIYDMADVISGKCRIKQALVCDEIYTNLMIMPSVHAMSSEEVGSRDFRALIQHLSEGFDFILIDCPAGIERGFHRAVSAATEAILVTTPHISAIRDGDKVLSLLSSYNLDSIGLVVNRVRGDLLLRGELMPPREIAELLRTSLIGVVAEDDRINVYSQLGKISENYSSREVFHVIADNILTGRRRILDATRQYKGVLGRIKLLIRSNA